MQRAGALNAFTKTSAHHRLLALFPPSCSICMLTGSLILSFRVKMETLGRDSVSLRDCVSVPWDALNKSFKITSFIHLIHGFACFSMCLKIWTAASSDTFACAVENQLAPPGEGCLARRVLSLVVPATQLLTGFSLTWSISGVSPFGGSLTTHIPSLGED